MGQMSETHVHYDSDTDRTYRAVIEEDGYVSIWEVLPGVTSFCGKGKWDGGSIQDAGLRRLLQGPKTEGT